MKSKTVFVFIAILVMVSLISFTVSCRKEAPAAVDEAGETGGTAAEDEAQEVEDAVSDEDGDSQEMEEAGPEIEIPGEITGKIDEAGTLFAGGLYAEASQAYRDAQIAIEGSDLPDETKAELLARIEPDHSQARNIADTARMHHSNAMTLIYEKRYEEAESELNAALEIYPKYQTAIDALKSLEDIKGLQ